MRFFWVLYLPFFISFIAKRLVLQTDMGFASLFGSQALTAATVSNNIMFIDQIVAMAIVPILSVKISEIKDDGSMQSKLELMLSSLFKLSLFLSIVAFCVYPHILRLVESNADTVELSKIALFWLNLSIVPEFFRYSLSIYLNSRNKGNFVLVYSIAEVIVNLLLNWFLVKQLMFGFEGIFITTFIVSTAICALIYRKAISDCPEVSVTCLIKLSNLSGNISNFKNFLIEFFRISIEKISFLIMLYVINLFSNSENELISFTVAINIYFLMLMPQLALMRSLTIFMVQNENDFKKNVKLIAGYAFLAILILVTSLFMLKKYLITKFYNIDNYELQQSIMKHINAFLLLLILNLITIIQRGVVYAKKQVKLLSQIDTFNFLLIVIPLFMVGEYFHSTLITWSGFYIAQILSIVTVHRYLAQKKTSPVFNQALTPNDQSILANQ